MNKFRFFLIVLALIGAGCNSQPGPSGPVGPTGSPEPSHFQTEFQDGANPFPSYSGELDTWLQAWPATITNALPYLEVNTGATYSNYGRVLVRFDVSSLPVDAQVIDAEVWLKLNPATSIGANPVTVGVHNLTSLTFSSCHWAANANWTGYSGGSGWNTCTGDSSPQQEGYINPTALSTVAFTSSANGTSAYYKWDIGASVVQSWLSNATNNNGLIFKSEGEFGEASSTVDFYPYNDATTANHPTLIVTYN